MLFKDLRQEVIIITLATRFHTAYKLKLNVYVLLILFHTYQMSYEQIAVLYGILYGG